MLTPEVQRLQNRVGELSRQGIKVGPAGVDLNLFESLSAEEQKLKIELDAPCRVKVLEEAVVSHADTVGRREWAAGLAALAVFAPLFLGISWMEFLRARS